jgi:hypothetical protein
MPNGTNTNCAAGIDLQTVTGVTMDGVIVTGGAQIGINGNNVTNMTLTDVEVGNVGNEANESGIQVHNLFGTVTWTNLNIHDNASRMLNIQNSSSTPINLTLQGGTYGNSAWPGSTTSAQGILFSGSNNANMTISILGSIIQRNFSAALQSDGNTGATLNVTMDAAQLIDNGQHFVVASVGSGNATYLFQNITNAWLDPAHTNVTPISIFLGSPSTGTFTGAIKNNVFGDASKAASGSPCLGCNIISVSNADSDGLEKIEISGNVLQRAMGGGINVTSGSGSSTDSSNMKIKIFNNTLKSPDGNGSALPITIVNATSAGDTTQTCANVQNNNISGTGGTGSWNMSAAIRLRHVQNATVYRLPGYTGAGTDDAAVQAYLAGRNTLNGGTAAVTRGAGTGTWGNTIPAGSDCF